MKNPLQILFLEDENHDAELVAYNLRNVAKVTQTETRASFEKSLVNAQYDVILMDAKLPDLNIEEAIQISRRAQPECPVILLTGSVGDFDAAAIAVKHGAVAHFLKDRIEGLPLAVQAAYEGRELRAQIIRNDRLEILGTLSASMVHDSNSIFQIVLSGAELLRNKINPMDTRILDAMERAAKRGAQMGQQIMMFARGSNGALFKPVSVEFLFGEVAQVLRSGAFPNIRSSAKTMIGTSKILCDVTQIIQVLLNLALNSRDALPHGGEIHLNAQNVSHVDGESFAINGNFVCITVSDNGTGIPEQALPRIWEAFFTTKAVGKGTGMGLAIVKSIVDSHGGVIQCKSNKNGTTFTIYLPAVEDVQQVPRLPQFDGSGKTVVLAEDEETLRLHLQLHLESVGYRVLPAANGPEALSHFRVGTEIHLLLTDDQMPILTGREIMDNLRSMGLELPVVFITGADAEILTDAHSIVLQKPFSTTLLLSTLRDVLNP